MSGNDKTRKGVSFVSNETGLQGNLPASFHGVKSARMSFDHARDPFISAQLKSLSQDEAKRREDGDGSRMVKLHKPFPELRPKHDLSQVRKSFNAQCLNEQRRAQMAQFQAEEQYLAAIKDPQHEPKVPTHGRSR